MPLHWVWLAVADPGFSPGEGGAPTPKVGMRTYFFGRKLHENERILAPGGGASLAPPLDPPLVSYRDSIVENDFVIIENEKIGIRN